MTITDMRKNDMIHSSPTQRGENRKVGSMQQTKLMFQRMCELLPQTFSDSKARHQYWYLSTCNWAFCV